MKLRNLSVLLLVFMILSLVNVFAANFNISRVDVDGISVFETGDAVHVERGKTSVIEVWIEGEGSSDRVKVKAWIGGYEHGDVRDTSNIFRVEDGVDYRKVLRLDIPEDIEATDDYTLHIEVFDKDDEVEKDFILRVEESRHLLNILDVIFRPSTTVIAGRALFTTVRVENLGYKKEEDIKVSVSIPELGISTRDYIDELITEQQERDEDDDDEEDSASSNELLLRIPEDAQEDDYNVVIEVEYDRGHEVLREIKVIHIKAAEVKEEIKALVNVDAVSRTLNQGEETAYKVMVANMGKESQVFSLEVIGEKLWATSRLDPAFVNVKEDATGVLYAYIKANEDAPEGRQIFTLKVKADDVIVQEMNLEINVVEDERGWATAKKVLTVLFIVLVILLIAIGLYLAFERMRAKEEPEEEATAYY